MVLTAVLGMMTTILSTLNERRREMAILRAVGARPTHVFTLLVSEAGALALAGVLLGVALLYLVLLIVRPIIDAKYGLYLPIAPLDWHEIGMLAAVVAAGLVAGAVPAVRAYFKSVADGIIVRT